MKDPLGFLNGKKAATFWQEDEKSSSEVDESFEDKVVMMDMAQALEKFDWLKDYMWKAVDKDKDEYTRIASEESKGGYFIHVKEGADVNVPVLSCIAIRGSNVRQVVHNIVIVEKGAKVNILSGCFNHQNVETSEHIGISEFYVKEGAYLNFTMVHAWNKQTFVRPRSSTIVEEGGNFISNYIALDPVKDLQMYPVCRLDAGSKATMTSLLYGIGNSFMDVGGELQLGEGSQGEIISRAIARDESRIISKGRIIGKQESKAHLECQGLLLSPGASIHAVPELIAESQDTDLSHEAAVGKIAEKELVYLMARGLTRDEATSVIVRGFLDVRILGLPEEFEKKVSSLIDRIEKN